MMNKIITRTACCVSSEQRTVQNQPEATQHEWQAKNSHVIEVGALLLPGLSQLVPDPCRGGRREAHASRGGSRQRGRSHNPAFLHPCDLGRLGLTAGDVVQLSSPAGSILAVVAPDADLREGVVAMSFGLGGAPGTDADFREIGSPPSRLLDSAHHADPYVGMPQLGNIAISIEPVPSDESGPVLRELPSSHPVQLSQTRTTKARRGKPS
jgi:hypothetical protein